MRCFIYFIFFVLTGCASTKFHIDVDSLSQHGDTLANYNNCYITTKNKNIDKSSLLYKEFYAYILQGIEENNINVLNAYNKANCLIYIDYGISAPKEKSKVNNIPNYGVTGYSSSNTFGTINNSGNFMSSTTYTPSYGITGYSQSISHYNVYSRYLSLEARSKKNNEQLWSVNVESTGSSGDLRIVFPYLMFVAKEKIAESTQNKEKYAINENDEIFMEYKNKININNIKSK